MNTSFESNKKGKFRKQKSIFSQQSRQLEDDNSDCQQSCDSKIDRSCQRYLFEIKSYQLEQGHQGDQDISDNGSVADQNVLIQINQGQQIQNQLKQEIPTINQKINISEAIPFSQDQSKKLMVSKLDMSFNNQPSLIEQNKEQNTPQEILFHELNTKDQEIPNDKTDKYQAQRLHTNISINQNIVSSPSQIKKNEKENKEKDQSLIKYQKNEGLIYEDFIFEKNIDNLSKKMTSAVNKILLLKEATNLTFKDYTTINDLCFYYKQHQKKSRMALCKRIFN
ncbi:cation channel family protein, putative (macronuclear) [Tetrahymena thermophila SB210]|uniref:Cation channel family protein, putative n=1 Tax=Tetrahymena thermophila (strain SB210) TaxID=312017 RepID=W7XLC9_TETTS|nr:cation channel family protein, putative [Tetrahymena thermophila SB210]EWS76069.1 cation channel family protein, putative [Tetrahymena thermophila SB210]|eukprot:XP_012651376.1 cation channel family protein, putative [Tetrahymena thermophila SB210]